MIPDGATVYVLNTKFAEPREDFVGSSNLARLADQVFQCRIVEGHYYLRCLKDRDSIGKDLELLEVTDQA